jgi:glycosyltransferase involved in cell wall biosynthesis
MNIAAKTDSSAIVGFPAMQQGSSAVIEAGPTAPTLSIIIPCFNVAQYVEVAVESALDQTFHDLEVIVVEDGSTDSTPIVLAALAARRMDPRLRIVHQPNGGLAAARNTGIELARGAFIGFLDSDDAWMPDKAERHLATMQADPTIGISFSNSAYMTEAGSRTGTFLLAGKQSPSLHDMIRRNHVGNGSAPVVRRACFEVAGLFRPDLKSCEDYEMWCRILWLCPHRAALLAKPLTLYRLRETSLSFNFEKFLENADRAMGYLQDAMPNVPARVFRAGHAEHYRIAAWKAISTDQTKAGRTLLMRAFALRPGLLVSDWRAIGSLVALILPLKSRMRLARIVKSIQQRSAVRQIDHALPVAMPPPTISNRQA